MTWLASSRRHIAPTRSRASWMLSASSVSSMYLPTRTSSTSRKPNVASPCLTVSPWGSLTTGLGVTITRAIRRVTAGTRKSLVARLGWKQRLADQAVVSGEISLARLRDDVVGQTGRIRLLVPPGTREPVAHELLVVGVRRSADLISGRLPVARAVGGERLADEAELELGIRKDESAALGERRCELVELDAGVSQLRGQLVAELLPQLSKGDVLVVAGLRLGRGREGRIGEPLALSQAGWHVLTRQRARVLVFLPRAPGKVSTHNAFEVDPLGLAHDHEAAQELVAPVSQRRGKVRHHPGDEMVLLERMRLREPEDGQLREHLPPIGDPVRQNVVESRDAVGGDHEQLVSSELVRVADLAAREQLERQVGLRDGRPGDHRPFVMPAPRVHHLAATPRPSLS